MRNPNTEVRNPNPNDRLLRFLQATPEQQAAIDRILDGRMEPAPVPPKGPLLMMIKDAVELLGVHRATIWRLLKAGRLEPVAMQAAGRAMVTARAPLPLLTNQWNVEASSNLESWSTLTNVPGLQFNASVLESPAAAARFYRVRSLR